MKLFTRLIDSGVFTFWSTDGDDATINLKIKIVLGDEKITLVDTYPVVGQNYYSFDRVGSGEYEIELNAIRSNAIYQTETKSIKISSSVQKNEENMQTLLGCIAVLNTKLSSIDTNIVDLHNLLLKINDALTDPQTIAKIKHDVAEYNSIWG